MSAKAGDFSDKGFPRHQPQTQLQYKDEAVQINIMLSINAQVTLGGIRENEIPQSYKGIT